ncbi:MAG: hypothetical protein ABIJ09_10660 [Pseudomonadota bacterium]
MRALLVDTRTCIAPFEERADEALFLSGTVRQVVDASLAQLRCTPVLAESAQALAAQPDELVLVLADRVFISHKALRDFLRAARTRLPARLSLRRTPSVDYLLPVTDLQPQALAPADFELSQARVARLEREASERVDHDVFLLSGRDLPTELRGEELLQALRERCQPVVVKKREIAIPVRLPTLGSAAQQTMRFPITSTVVAELRHWVHVLWLNQLALGIFWMDRLRQRPLWMLWRAATALPWTRTRLLQRLVVRGRRCRIHPTAHVELSVLGDDVVVGPHASIRNSFVGNGAEIGSHATVLNSSIGPGSFITEKTFVIWSACYPGATIGNYKLQVSLIGRDAHLNAWAGLIDAKFQGQVQVERGGRLMSTERSFLGSCVGHRAVVASKILVLPGRAIPNDAIVVMRPDEVVSEIPSDLATGQPLVRDHGTLVPLSSLR